ncbi:hypothetical protein [Vineibacter terrae]|uniref:hypothetical protein n=1 Tax=Vineibacter terrae TaxID=2586908 RepID=UPI002E2FEA31|nr:hypothetical protein [Vineibacter terrae]HEX2888104.1 hypothetical protein [Vineibacter terrae]
MALMLVSLFIGFLWSIGLLAVVERLVAWRWPANKRNRKENKKRKKGAPPQDRRVSPGAFHMAAGGSIAGSLMVANVVLDIVSAIMAAPADAPTFVPFVVGASGALLLRRDRLPPVLHAAGVAVREFLVERAKAQQQPTAPPDPVGRRFREPVSSVIDAPVTPIIRTLPPASARQPDLPPIMVTIPAPRRNEPTLAQRRREIVSHLKARSAALAAMAPPRAPVIVPAAEPAAAALASQAAATIAETRALHEIWQAEATAQREQWRQAGEAQRAQWRREAQALGRAWDKPSGNDT